MDGKTITELKIPDVWYDFYARFIPGLVFVFSLRFFLYGHIFSIGATDILVMMFISYIVGLINQPIASTLTERIEKLAIRKYSNKNLVPEVQHKLGQGTRRALVLSKMKGEISCFSQLFFITIYLFLIYLFIGGSNYMCICWFVVFMLYFPLGSYSFALRRNKKAERYYNSLS